MAEGRADRLIALWSQVSLQARHVAPAGHIPMAVVGAESAAPKAAGVSIKSSSRRIPQPRVEGHLDESAPCLRLLRR